MRLHSNTDDDMSLDELINIINAPKRVQSSKPTTDVFSSDKDLLKEGARNLPPIEQNIKKMGIKKFQDRSGIMNQSVDQRTVKPKTLLFKPWSGKIHKYE